MGYKVVVTSDAEKDFDRFIQYLLFVFIDNIFHELQDYENRMM